MMAAKLSPAERSAAVSRVRELHAEGMGLNAIARELGLSASTVSQMAKQEGLSFDRAATRNAVEARKVDAAAMRAELQIGLLQDAKRLRSELWSPCTVFNFGGKDNTYEEREIDAPPFADKLKLVQAVGVAITHSLRIADHDANTADLPVVDAWLQHMTGGADGGS